MKHKISLLWAWFVMLTLCWIPDFPLGMRFRGFLLGICMKHRGSDFQVAAGVRIKGLCYLSVGDHVYFANGVIVIAGKEVVIDDEVMLGPNVVVVDGNHTKVGSSYRFGKRSNKEVRIGRGAWIGAGVTICAGSRVGEGAVVGANSVVVKDIPANVVAIGAPATPR